MQYLCVLFHVQKKNHVSPNWVVDFPLENTSNKIMEIVEDPSKNELKQQRQTLEIVSILRGYLQRFVLSHVFKFCFFRTFSLFSQFSFLYFSFFCIFSFFSFFYFLFCFVLSFSFSFMLNVFPIFSFLLWKKSSRSSCLQK